MYIKQTAVLAWVICLSCKVVMTGCQVVLVNRNVTDSFRVGEDGCTKDTSVCMNYNSSCQSDGQCLCLAGEPNFRMPNGAQAYGCVSNKSVQEGIKSNSSSCTFGPFQLIPSARQPDSATAQFSDPNVTLSSCTLKRAEAKFPNNATEINLHWLDPSYVNLTIIGGKALHLQWNKSVPSLRGTIITLHLNCTSGVSFASKCLRAKIRGTWRPDHLPLGELSSSDDDSRETVVIAIVVPLVLLIDLAVVVVLFRNRKNSYSRRDSRDGLSRDELSRKTNDSPRLVQFRHSGSNLRELNTYEDEQDMDTSETFGAQDNYGYSTPDTQNMISEVNPLYATSDIKTDENKSTSDNPEPVYEAVDLKKIKRNDDSYQVDPGYATPDVNRREINRANRPISEVQSIMVV